MTQVVIQLGGHPTVVTCPDGSSVGRLSVDMLATLAQAKATGMQACFIRPPAVANEHVFAMTSDEVPIARGDGLAWARARWEMSAVAQRLAERWRDGVASFWHEIGREIRHYAGNERLPADVRMRVREASQRALAKSAGPAARVARYPRRLLRERVQTLLPAAPREQSQMGPSRGIALDASVVAIDSRLEPNALSEASAFLVRNGYEVVRLNCTLSSYDLFVLSVSCFAVCASVELQQVAYLTNTPSLLLNAPDPFVGYPVREDGLFTLAQVIDLDDGRLLTLRDLLTESYYRNVRNCGYRPNTAADVLQAVQDMHEGVTQGWRDSESQTRFRAQVVEAGTALADRVRHVAEWGPDRGFIGDGRLVRFQADEAQ